MLLSNCFPIQYPLQPLLFIACQHQNDFRQSSWLSQQFDNIGWDFVFFNVEKVAIDENLVDSIENVFQDFNLMIFSIEVSSLFKQLRIFDLLALFIELRLFKSFIVVSFCFSFVLLVL